MYYSDMETLNNTIQTALQKTINQGERCIGMTVSGNVACVYQSKDFSKRCAVGHVLSHDLIDLVKNYIGNAANLMDSFPEVMIYLSNFQELQSLGGAAEVKLFWSQFQLIHDRSLHWTSTFDFTAAVNRFTAKYPFLDQDMSSKLDFTHFKSAETL